MRSEGTRFDGRTAVFDVIATPPERLLLPVRSADQERLGTKPGQEILNYLSAFGCSVESGGDRTSGPVTGALGNTRLGDTTRWTGRWYSLWLSWAWERQLRGEWYYDSQTGFLVGVTRSTAVSGAGGLIFTLTDSNFPDLGLR
jgi:hypothetical protein